MDADKLLKKLRLIERLKKFDDSIQDLIFELECELEANEIISIDENNQHGQHDQKNKSIDSLNRNQQEVFNQLNDWFLNKGTKEYILSGAAGTGKTYLIAKFIKHLEVTALFLTPTHKAKKVLDKALLANSINSEILTIAQGLGNQPIINEKGEQEFVALSENKSLDNRDLVIIDESSMINENDFRTLRESISGKILWVGDKYQLPPIKENVSPVFNSDINIVELTQVVRYTGHILNECLSLRDAINTGSIYHPKSNGLTVINTNKIEATLLAKEMFISSEFKEDNTYCRFLGFRNLTIDNFNRVINQLIVPNYNPDEPYYLGQNLIANRPIIRLSNQFNGFNKKRKYNIIANNSDEMTVTSEPIEHKIMFSNAFQLIPGLRFAPKLCQKIEGTITTFWCKTESGIIFEAVILHEDCQQSKQKLFNEAKRTNDKSSMKFLYSLGDDLKDIWGITVHKSQGSTFKNIFLDVSDILKKSSLAKEDDKDFRAEMLYTGFSRASKMVYLIYR